MAIHHPSHSHGTVRRALVCPRSLFSELRNISVRSELFRTSTIPIVCECHDRHDHDRKRKKPSDLSELDSRYRREVISTRLAIRSLIVRNGLAATTPLCHCVKDYLLENQLPQSGKRAARFALSSPILRIVPTARSCSVSFIDSEGVTHAVEIIASTLYEAAALAAGGVSPLRIRGCDVWSGDEDDCARAPAGDVPRRERGSAPVVARWRREESRRALHEESAEATFE